MNTVRTVFLPFLALALFTLDASTTRAQDAVTGEAIETHATFTNVGIQVRISGDDDRDAEATLEVDVDGAGYQPAHRLSRVGDDRFIGTAFFLPNETAFEVRVTLTDPDGVTNGTLTSSGTTRRGEFHPSSGETYHVDGASGADSNDGSAGAPFATVGRGIEAAQPGDTVLVHAGIYHEEITLPRGGTPSAPITLAGTEDGEAILDGADPALKDPSAWTDEGGNVHSAAVSPSRYVAVDGVRLWRYESLADLQNLSLGTDGGFFHDGTRVHVRLPGDAAPAGHEIQVSTLGRALWLEGTPDVVIYNLTFRCYGAEEYSEAIMVRDGSHRVWIAANLFENNMPGVWIKNDVDDLTVMDNEFSDRGLAEFPWHAVKAQGGMESGAIAVDSSYDGQGIVFFHNRVSDSFDGLNICGNEEMDHPNNADVHDNHFRHLADDGIETDGVCHNVRITHNSFTEMLVGVSVAPAVGGPTYVIRNYMVELQNVAPDSDWSTRAMKFNVGDDRPSGEIFAYHNTGATLEAEQASFTVTDDSRWEAVHLLNNIWTGTHYAFEYTNAGDEPFTQNHDLFHSTGDQLIRFQGECYDSPAAYFAAEGLCESCLEGDPQFVDPADGSFRISEGSPAEDTGVLIPGVNDDFVGAGPDIGAHEIGGPDLDTDVDTDVDSDTDADADADTDGDADAGGDADGDGDADTDLTDGGNNDGGSTGDTDTSSCGCLAAGTKAPVLSTLIALL